jgi:DNA-binding response OmpR family regulator
MVIDDDEMMRVLSEDAVYGEGWRFQGEPDGLRALEAFEVCVPDLLIVDAHMPKMDGFELIEAIRKAGINENLPILMVTADNDLESINRAYDIGATGFEVKPINWPLLVHRIRHLLRSAETLEQLSQTANALERSQSALIRAQGVAKLGSWEWHGQRKTLTWSNGARRVLGLGMNVGGNTFTPSVTTFAALIPPRNENEALGSCKDCSKANLPGSSPKLLPHPTGKNG